MLRRRTMSWREDTAALPALGPPPFELALHHTALVIIDMQYVDAHREYALGKSLRESHPEVWDYYFTRVEEVVIPNAQRLLDTFRSAHARVIHITVGPELPDGSDLLPFRRGDVTPELKAQLFPEGTFEHQILPELAPIEGELVINKTSRSPFSCTGIERVLLNLGIDSLLLVGVTTSACVETTGRDASDRAFKVVLVEDATAELDEASHDAALKQFASRWGRVWTTGESIEAVGSFRSR
jgi:nicotinamidase-related amidase